MMSSTTDNDPFLQVQADVFTQLTTTRPLFTSYLRIFSLQSTSSSTSKLPSPELISAKQELEDALEILAEDLADLQQAILAVQKDPYKYGLEIEEVSRRKAMVDEVGGEVDDMREELLRTAKVAHQSLPGNARAGGGDDDGLDYNAEFEQQQQTQMMAEQDEQLDDVYRTVGNLRMQANEMGRELEEQTEMLETVDGLADRVGGRLQMGMKSMATVVKRNEDGLSSCCIGVLIIVLCVLLVLVLIL
ncbi:syntaxin 6 [Calycina marina]|uniref:t-SNARE affecting a late Golgi compartment protein 1 n=1 Tax=Calycina marina TaxID=1763456 RepID=A0A9P7Z5F2_9HELO|nr:syntaxin 6 [Calycina marina]